MNITPWKNRQLNLEDAAQKHAQARHAPSIPLQANVDAGFTAAPRLDPKPMQAEQGLLRQTTDMGALSAGALTEKERLRSSDQLSSAVVKRQKVALIPIFVAASISESILSEGSVLGETKLVVPPRSISTMLS